MDRDVNAIGIVRQMVADGQVSQEVAERYFPELKVSEDERIRKAIILFFESEDDNTTYSLVPKNDILAWLEKQGEHNRSCDSIELKFKVGDWVIFNEHHNSVYQVEKIQGLRYYLRHYTGGSLSVHIDNQLIRPWNINDAKDGDVLACNEEILLFKSYSVQGRISLYCWYNGRTNNFHDKEVDNTLVTTRNKICPATEEQRDTLEKAMADAGYTFDFEKKELKKIVAPIFHIGDRVRYKGHACDGVITEITDTDYICGNAKLPISTQDNLELVEQKPAENSAKVSESSTEEKDMGEYKKGFECGKQRVLKYPEDFGLCKKPNWSEEDENRINRLIAYFEDKESFTAEDDIVYANWLKSLKDRVKPQPKPAWSEEEQQIIEDAACIILDCVNTAETKKEEERLEELADKLQNLKPQNTWKPSDEQVNTLEQWLKDNQYKGDARYCYPIFESLYQDLKKLREE